MLLRSTLFKKPSLYTLLIAVFIISGCMPNKKPNIPATKLSNFDGSNTDLTAEILGVKTATDGWYEYKFTIRNNSHKGIKSLRGIVNDEKGHKHNAAVDSNQLSALPSAVGKDQLINAGAQSAGMGLAMMGIPFVGPIIATGAAVAGSASLQSAAQLEANFDQYSLSGKDVYSNDEINGSFYFPAVKPTSIKIGYVKSGRREWLNLNSSSHRTTKITRGDETTKQVQQLLNELGYPCGVADGIPGTKTKEAVKRYQTDKGIPVDGVISTALLENLKQEK